MKKHINIGLMGLNFGSTNLGCAALAVSFFSEIINIIKKLNVDCTFYIIGKESTFCEKYSPEYPVVFQEYRLKSFRTFYKSLKLLRLCDIVFDFTEGDSFSDIYGKATFYKSALLKMIVEKTNIKLVLGPQTYGPFGNKDCEVIAKYIIRHAYAVFSRDEKSRNYLFDLGVRREIQTTTDIAYRLPFYKMENMKDSNKIRVGINISGLLWEDVESKKNRLKLKTDYVEYTCQIIQKLLNDSRYEVYLISHVGTSVEDTWCDYDVCHKVKQKYPKCNLLPGFDNPISAKTELAKMDIVIAARMHASIGAFSSGVFTIPFSYSRKFQGYYGMLEYPIMVDGTSDTTNVSVQKTLTYVERYNEYKEQLKKSQMLAQDKLDRFYDQVCLMLKEL